MSLPPHLTDLGITEDHLTQCKLELEAEAEQLVDAGLDVFDRPLKMTPETFAAWQDMHRAAKNQGIELQIVSGFRSIKYQCDLISGKLANGRNIDEILSVNAIPGYSEHHSGRALDLTTPNCTPLEEEFESTPAYEWLLTNAEQFQFYLSYPKDNTSGIDYEPWHWTFRSS